MLFVFCAKPRSCVLHPASPTSVHRSLSRVLQPPFGSAAPRQRSQKTVKSKECCWEGGLCQARGIPGLFGILAKGYMTVSGILQQGVKREYSSWNSYSSLTCLKARYLTCKIFNPKELT